tara:strand:+ start:5862 stop:6884 length:1023 start_codon:yes stop_codon:yes gene_type:complete
MGYSLEKLTSFDSQLKIIVDNSKVDVESLTNVKALGAHRLVFISSKKFLEQYLAQASRDHFLCFDQKFFNSLEQELVDELSRTSLAVLTTQDFPMSMCTLSKVFYEQAFENFNDLVDGRQMGTAEIDPSVEISQGVFIGKDVKIGANSKIHAGVVILSQCEIGENCEIFPNVTINQNTKIENDVRIHSGTVIGSDGYGYNFKDGVHHKIWHMGGVKIESHVEIGANSCIDQGTFSPTFIGSGTKIDNHVQIAHNVLLGKGVIICGQCAIAGSATVGDFTVMGGKAALGNDIIVGKACQIAGAAMVTGNLEDGAKVAGHPARPLREWLKGIAYLRKNSLNN